MNARTEERVEGWTSRPFTDGHEGLHDLADEEFSGVVETEGGAWLCLLNGKVVGVFEGSIDDFEDAAGTTYVAPDPALPLLFAMQERGGTVEEEYYTEDTPISEANETLSSGSFTGYIELSENVLSGDYYVLYYGGRSMSVAFLGSSERRVTGDEAFDRADDEVGIYEVRSVDVEVVDVPAPAGSEPEDGTDARGDAAREDEGTSTATGADQSSGTVESDPPGATAESDPSSGTASDPSGATAGATDRTGDDAGTGDTTTADGTRPSGATGTAAQEGDPRDGTTGTASDRPGTDGTTGDGASGPAPDRGEAADPSRSGDPLASGRDADTDAAEGRPPADEEGSADTAESAGRRGSTAERPDERLGDRRFRDEAAWRKDPSVPSIAEREPDEDRLEEVNEALDEHEAALERLYDELEALDREARTDRDRLRGGLDDLSEDLADLRRSVMRLDQSVDRIEENLDDRIRRVVEAELRERSVGGEPGPGVDRPEAGSDPGPASADAAEEATPADADGDRGSDGATTPDADAGSTSTAPDAGDSSASTTAGDGPDLSVDEALEGTTLLVRYGSQGKPTLKSAHGGGADRAEVNDNLRIDAHTPFDADAATVEGQPFRAFLADRMEYRFFEWVVRDLLYEIRETGNDTALEQLYDAVPRIDRAEMHTTVSVPAEDDPEEEARVRFDVVARDARGTPMVVANLNDSRDPATQGMVVELNERATRVREAGDLGGAFLVTASYFEGEARETAEDATSGSLLSRDSRKSFVKLSRKRGYHLCLVEASDGGFHVSVPEL